MGGILLSSYEESVADFLPDNLYLDNALVIIDIEEDPIIPDSQFPASNGVGSHRFDPTGLEGRPLAEMDLQAVDDHSPCIGSQPPQMGLGLFGEKDRAGLGHRGMFPQRLNAFAPRSCYVGRSLS
jgi:hypothetical protein